MLKSGRGQGSSPAKMQGRATGEVSTFENIIVRSRAHSAREAGLPGRADREAAPCADCASAIPRPSMEGQ